MQKTVFKWWWGWNPEVVEEWLERQESAGWNLYNVDLNALRFHFSKGQPRKMRYCADYQNEIGPDYKRIYEDDGWKLVWSSLGWYIWAKPYEGKRPSIYTDVESLVARNNRLSHILAAATVILVAGQMPLLVNSFIRRDFSAMGALVPMYAVTAGLFGYFFVELRSATSKLKERTLRK